ncbi:DUF3987 domain-containing protein [Leptothoe sp. ISB3NOV94-8A]
MGNRPGREVSKDNPCPICGKPDWCFRLDDGISYNCKRNCSAPKGWIETPTRPSEGRIFRPESPKSYLETKAHTNSPVWKRTGEYDGKGFEQEIIFIYSPTQRVIRRQWSDRREIYKGQSSKLKNKFVRPQYRDGKSWQRGKGREPWPLYREDEVHHQNIVLFVGGETCVEAARKIGLTAVCMQGGETTGKRLYEAASRLQKLNPKLLAIWPDNDEAGRTMATELLSACQSIDVNAIIIEPSDVVSNPPEKWDIADYVTSDISSSEGRAAIQVAIDKACQNSEAKPIQSPNKVVNHPSKFTPDTLRHQLSTLAHCNPNEADKQIELTRIALEQGQSPQQINRIYQATEHQQAQQEAIGEVANALVELNTIRQSHLPIEAGLYGDGGQLARILIQTAEAMPTATEFVVTTLIPVLASRIGTSSTLRILDTGGYTQKAIFRTLIVAKTGCKKTPAQKIIIGALECLEEIHHETYKLELEQHEAEMNRWESLPKERRAEEPKPKSPTRKRYFSTDDTLAARIQIHAENPRGLLLYRDEGSAFINERGRFNRGKGDGGETEADLSEFNGGSINRDRKGDGSTFLAKTAISRTGAIQYAKLQELMGTHHDACGEFARYLFCAAEAPPSYLNLAKDVGDIGLQKSLIDLIEYLDELPERDYSLCDSAKRVFEQYQHQLTDRGRATDHPSLQAAFPKFETYFGRFCLLLHIINAALARQEPDFIVSAQTVELARQWTEYYIGQYKLLMATNSPQQGLTGDLLQLHQYLERRPERTVRQIVQARLFDRASDKSKRKTPYIRELLAALVEQGWVTLNSDKYSSNQSPTGPAVISEMPVSVPEALSELSEPDASVPIEELADVNTLSSSMPIEQETNNAA